MSKSEQGRGNIRSLTDALRRARIADAERTDVVVELREAERARLDMLADELRGVFAELPADDDQFLNSVVPGNPPRLWIDATSFVIIGRDRRLYRFLKDTRLGRTVILESASIDDMADTITNYIAGRVIERERAIEGDWLVRRASRRRFARQDGRALPGRDVGQSRHRLGGRRVRVRRAHRRRRVARLCMGQFRELTARQPIRRCSPIFFAGSPGSTTPNSVMVQVNAPAFPPMRYRLKPAGGNLWLPGAFDADGTPTTGTFPFGPSISASVRV